MENKSVKEILLSYFSSSGKIFEQNGATGPDKNDPDKDAKNPDLDSLLYGDHRSILFLTSPDKNGIIKRGGNMGFLELNSESIGNSQEVDLEDFQWYCRADQFEEYLKVTGRSYNKETGDWTSESEEAESDSRKILKYSDFLAEKEEIEQLNEFTGVPLLGNTGTNITGKGMSYSEKKEEFEGGKITDEQRRFVRFIFARNAIRNSGKMEESINLNKIKNGEILEIFVTSFDPETGKSDEMSMVGITFKVLATIKAEGDISSPMLVGEISKISPNLGSQGEGGFQSILEEVVNRLNSMGNSLGKVLSTTSGKLFMGVAAAGIVAKIYDVGKYFLGMWFMRSLIRNSTSQIVGSLGGTVSTVSRVGFIGRMGKGIFNFIKYPITVIKNINRARKFTGAVRASMKGWKLARYILFGKKVVQGARTASRISRGARIAGGIAKWSNPVGWVLLAADVIGSTINYTSDNQAPSWDPIIGGKSDAMKNYAGSGGICSTAKNSFSPQDIPTGETITLCWTQNPESGFALALSFVASVSTRTTMNLTKICDFNMKGQKMCLFIINSVNYKGLWNSIKEFDLRFLFIKAGKYEEGYVDDNIGAAFLGAKMNPSEKEGILPISYYGHCDFTVWDPTYKSMVDQLVVIDKDSPDTFNFYFEDSESNIINVFGTKVKDSDIQDASSEEIENFFTVQPVSSFIGNPDNETEEEKEQRKALEDKAKQDAAPGEEEPGENPEEETEEEIQNESEAWYRSIKDSKPITSFREFKQIKESYIFEEDGKDKVEVPSGEGGEKKEEEKEKPKGVSGAITSLKDMQENFENIIDTVEAPFPFCIYFVELREYADPKLRSLYKPGSFMNFSVSPDAVKASDGQSIQGQIEINNLDILLDVRKGTYKFSEKDTKVEIEDKDLEKITAGGTIKTSILSSDKERLTINKEIEKGIEPKEKKTVLQRMDPDQLSSLGISNWQEISSVKIIRDNRGNPVTVKIKNRKAGPENNSKRFDSGNPNFENALILAKAYKEDKEESELLSEK